METLSRKMGKKLSINIAAKMAIFYFYFFIYLKFKLIEY